MKPTTGLFWTLYFSRYSAASSSIEPPISPMRTMPARSLPRQDQNQAMDRRRREKRGRTLGRLVLHEDLEHVDVLRPGEGVAANAHAQRLAEANLGRRVDGLVRQRAGARHDACVGRGG